MFATCSPEGRFTMRFSMRIIVSPLLRSGRNTIGGISPSCPKRCKMFQRPLTVIWTCVGGWFTRIVFSGVATRIGATMAISVSPSPNTHTYSSATSRPENSL